MWTYKVYVYIALLCWSTCDIICEHVLATNSTQSLHGIWEYTFHDNHYNKYVRPVRSVDTVTTVRMDLGLIAIIDLSELKQTITVAAKVSLRWFDEFITWDPANFSNVEHIHVQQSEIWKPFIFVENSVKKQSEFGTPCLHTLIHNDGLVDWRTIEVFETTCTTDVTKFPFDQQTCSLIFEPSGYSNTEMKVISDSDHFDIHSYGGISGWTIVETNIMSIEEDNSVHVVASLTLKRNPSYFILNIMMPIALLSFLNSCVFLLPVSSGEKASYVVTVFLSLAVFLTIVSGKLPENSDHLSLLNFYVFLATLVSVLIALVTLIQIRIYQRDPVVKVPRCLAKFAIFFNTRRRTRVISLEHTDDTLCQERNEKRLSMTSVHSINVLEKPKQDNHTSEPDLHFNDSTRNVSWPDVVEAMDAVLFISSLVIYLVLIIVFITVAKTDDGPEHGSPGGHSGDNH